LICEMSLGTSSSHLVLGFPAGLLLWNFPLRTLFWIRSPSLYFFSCESNDISAPVLNSVRTFRIPRIKLFFLSSVYQSSPRHLWGFLNINSSMGWGRSDAQSTSWRTRVSFLVWVITFDLFGMGDPASSYATASIALRIIDHARFTTTSE
jgi:hypothetical protein